MGNRLEPGINHSYRGEEFETGDLVITPDGENGVVHPSSQYEHTDPNDPDSPYHMVYRVKVADAVGKTRIAEVIGEGKLKAFDWKTFVWYRNPESTRMSVGKTRGWMAILIHVFSIIIFGCGFTVVGPWKIAPFVLGAGTIGLFWLGTWKNFTKQWV